MIRLIFRIWSPTSLAVPRRASFVAIFVTLVTFANTASALDYRFQVETMQLDVKLLPDSSAELHYRIKFNNQPGAHPIDIVDVGLPHSNYRINTMSANVDGRPAQRIRRSEYINVGVECHLGSGTIMPGASGTFDFICVMPNMVYADVTDPTYASFQIRPTWFDPQLQVGTTKLQVAIHLPSGVASEEVRYQDESQRYAMLVNLSNENDDEGTHVVAYWEAAEMTLSSANPKFSVSFPRSVMERVVEKTKIELFLEWFDASPRIKLASGIALFALFGFLFYRFSRGTGCVLMAISGVLLAVAIFSGPGPHLLCWPALLSLIGINEAFLAKRRPDDNYLPAMATVEGGGIKRGLTAPQAAVLLEEPLGKVLTMVIFGLLKKRIIELVHDEPAKVKVDPQYVCQRKLRRKRAGKNGVVIHDYEHPFLDRLQAHQGTVESCDLNESLGGLIKGTAERMKGFDLKRTREYYRRIVRRAWKDAESIGEIEKRDEIVERNFEWMMMEDTWIDLFDIWRRRGYTYRPRWSRPTVSTGGSGRDWTFGGGKGTTSGGVPSGGDVGGAGADSTSAPTISEVASGFIGWAENTSGKFASAIEPASMGLKLNTATIDLSGFDRATGEFFDALAEAGESSGSSGGGGGGCACACAGCACACACAGGGR